MKILNIRFKNINSLEGENRIDFELPPFSETGVFAITGPNGAGKSSILDAITLGLYGETFRFDRPGNHVMTRNTAECYVEIEFALDKQKYRSSWQVQRQDENPEAEITPPDMKLIRLTDNEVLATGAQQVCQRITEITGMNFRNFTRSILLAQGDFAAFLNALDTERMDILEKIISTDIYADYKNQILEKAAEAQQRLDYLLQDLAVIPTIEPLKLEAYEQDLTDFIEQTTELSEQQSSLQQQQATLQNVFTLQNRLAAQEKNLQQTQVQAESEQQLLARLTLAQDALLFTDELEVVKQKNQELAQGKATLADFGLELKQIKEHLGDQSMPAELGNKSFVEQGKNLNDLKSQIGQLSAQRQAESDLWQSLNQQITQKTADQTAVSNWLAEHNADATLVSSFPETGRLKKLWGELTELKAKQKAYAKWTKTTGNSLKNNQSAIAQENKRIAELKHKLPLEEQALKELAQGKNLPELEDFYQEQQERVTDFRELHALAKAHQKLRQNGFSFFGLLTPKEQPSYDIEALEAELESLKHETVREENIKLTLDAAVFRENLLKKMVADRQHLVDGEPCYLCGASEHPYAYHPPREVNSQQALTDQKAKIKALIVAIGKLEQQIKIAKKLQENNQANLNAQQKLTSQWQILSNRLYTASEDLNIHKLGLMSQLLDAETKQLKIIGSVVTDYKNKQTTIEQLKALIEKGDATVNRLQLTQQQLDTEWQERPNEEIDYTAALMALEQEVQQLSEQVTAQLTLLGEKMPAKGKEDALYDRLTVRRQDYQSYAFRQKSLEEELESLTTKVAHCAAEAAVCAEKLEQLNKKLQGEEIIGLHLALLEKQKLKAEKEQLLATQEHDFGQLKQALQDKLQGTPFATLPALTDILEQLQQQPELEQHLTERQQQLDAMTLELEKNRLELDAEMTKVSMDLSLEQLEVQLKRVGEQSEIAKLETQRLEQLLKEQQLYQQKAEAIQVQVQDQEQIAQRCHAEVRQITEESGIDFRRRVQKRIADQLLSQTNAVLEKVSGRYYLRQVPSEQGLALEIEDTYQGNGLRLPKTLSGGESFVVSLALALGLSELANNGKSVDSLFLDEGFGNLDAETLYTVISTLEGLQTHGKTVGVISHVEGVQKRFKAQLQIVKKPNGMGMLKQAS